MTKRKKAVALKYDYEQDAAPKVLAKGEGYIAEKIIKLAEEEKISTCANPVLVEKLALLDIGETIPEELYHVVAEILVFVDGLTDY